MKYPKITKKNISCISGCRLNIYDKTYTYWENRNTTSDEIEIVEFLKKKKIINQQILHIGIGNSYFAKSLFVNNKIIGITILESELLKGNELNIENYKIIIKNKYQKDFILRNNKFNIIVDVNLKSYSCCQKAFEYYFKNLCASLKRNSTIITSKKGMRWTSNLTPKYSFSLKNFFKKKLKESKGLNNNILSKKECVSLAKNNKMKLKFSKKSNIVIFKKS